VIAVRSKNPATFGVNSDRDGDRRGVDRRSVVIALRGGRHRRHTFNDCTTSLGARPNGIPMDRDCISPAVHSAFRNADEMLDFVE
jgi:hypothetical protein